MFDIGWPELMVIAVVALVAIGPKDLPFALRTIGRFVAKARTMARDFQTHVDDMVREAELDELRKKATEIRDTVDIKKHVQNAIDPSGSIRDALTPPSNPMSGVDGSSSPAPLAPGADANGSATTPAAGPVVYDPASGALAPPSDPVFVEAPIADPVPAVDASAADEIKPSTTGAKV